MLRVGAAVLFILLLAWFVFWALTLLADLRYHRVLCAAAAQAALTGREWVIHGCGL